MFSRKEERPRFIIKVEIKGCCSVQCLTEVWTRLRDNGKIDIVKLGVYEIKAFAVEYFWYTLMALFFESIFAIVDYVVIFV